MDRGQDLLNHFGRVAELLLADRVPDLARPRVLECGDITNRFVGPRRGRQQFGPPMTQAAARKGGKKSGG